MKAIIHKRYGPPEVAELKEVPQPVQGENQLLIKVMASTVNRTDCGFRSAEYFISRFWSGLFKPRQKTLGCEFAGIVAAVGKNVIDFHVGDHVFGFNEKQFGGHAEYMTIDETGAVALMPASFSFEKAAPLTEGAHYAMCDIRAAEVASGQQVLVYGATGAIGSAAVQILKHMGVWVTAVCGTQHVAMVRSLGADEVIDYQQQDFTKSTKQFDFVFDAVGKTSFGACKPLLTTKGIYISTELGRRSENVFLALWTPWFGGKKVLFPIPSIQKEDVLYIQQIATAGKFTPVIDRTYPLEEIVEAYHYVESGQKTGNVVILVQQD